MADSFTRDSLKVYESKPQKQIPDKVMVAKFMDGSTPARAASAADMSVPTNVEGTSQILDIAPGGTPAVAAATGSADDAPVVDEDGTLGDPTDSGEGTSDELTADPSTATGDPGTDAELTDDLTATPSDEEGAPPAPPKGSAQERIVELNDLYEGAKVFGKAMQEQLKAQMAENARLAAERSATSGGAPAAAPLAVSDDPGPMPDLSDKDINFDTDKYRARLQEWSTKNARHAARAIVQEMTGASAARTLEAQVNTKVSAYVADHPEFKEVVIDNPVLKANMLAPDAGNAVARSPYTAEILMRFGNDPGYAIRVARMPVADQLVEIGEIVAAIKAEKKKVDTTTTTTTPKNKTTPANRGGAQPAARKSVSQAPPPPRATPAAGRTQAFDPLDPNVSVEEFARQHRAGKETARKENRRLRGLS